MECYSGAVDSSKRAEHSQRRTGPSATQAGLCASCCHCRVIESDRGSVFYRCELSSTDAAFPKYPRLPVLQCGGYTGKK